MLTAKQEGALARLQDLIGLGLDLRHQPVQLRLLALQLRLGGGLLVPGGTALFECGWKQAADVAAILEAHHFTGIGITEDLAGVPRIVYGCRAAHDRGDI